MGTEAPFAINGRFLGQHGTGVQRYALQVTRALDQALPGWGHDAVVIAPNPVSDEPFNNMRLIRGGALRGHAWEQADLPRLAPGRLLNLCNTAPAFKSDQIVCIHDANVFVAPESYSFAFRTLYQQLQPRMTRNAARICAVSQAAARQISRHLPIRSEDIAVLPNGHEHALAWNPALAQIARSTATEIEKRERSFVLVIGSRAQHKNLALIHAIADSLDDIAVDIVVAGGGANIYASEAIAGKRNVHMLGRVSDHDLAFLYDSALCLAFPSFTEGFGLPIVEAMARGCPVISSDCASMPEVCGEAALLASPFDGKGWIAHIEALKQSRQLAADLVGRGYEQVRNFSWTKTADGYRELLEEPARRLSREKTYARGLVSRLAVVFATRGRPDVVENTVHHLLATQTLKPHSVIISCVTTDDAGNLNDSPDVKVVTGPGGLAAQRNTALENLTGIDYVVFFDDDFVADKNWLADVAEIFRDESSVVGVTGRVVADGIKGPGLHFKDALRLVADAPQSEQAWIEPFSPYGCNMAFRISAIGDLRFDERLPLYGWLEDRDFGAALARRGGRLIKSFKPFGVHMGTKVGRVSGERLGYSQIVNPVYMLRKGTMSVSEMGGQISRNMLSNFGRIFWPEPFIDRRGRSWGNLLGITDLLRGRLEPERAASLGRRAKIAMQSQKEAK